MTANTKLVHAIADALIGEYGEDRRLRGLPGRGKPPVVLAQRLPPRSSHSTSPSTVYRRSDRSSGPPSPRDNIDDDLAAAE